MDFYASAPAPGPAPERRERSHERGDGSGQQDIVLYAHAVREVIEEIAVERRYWSTYRKEWNSPMSLSGACAYASRVLVRVLARHGIVAEICVGSYDLCEHCWVELRSSKDPDRNLIVDVTATQFSPAFSIVRFTDGDRNYSLRTRGLVNSRADRAARRFDCDEAVPDIRATTNRALRLIARRQAVLRLRAIPDAEYAKCRVSQRRAPDQAFD